MFRGEHVDIKTVKKSGEYILTIARIMVTTGV